MTEFVTFRVGEQLCGVEAAQVQHIFRPQGLVPAPLAPPEIRGVMSLRGRIVTAVCARTRLGLPPGGGAIAIGLEHQGDSYGLLVDSVAEVLSLEPTPLAAPPGALPSRWADSVRAVCQLESELLLILDAVRLLEPQLSEAEA
jgi:purine-binding chemotaxis protein CheW